MPFLHSPHFEVECDKESAAFIATDTEGEQNVTEVTKGAMEVTEGSYGGRIMGVVCCHMALINYYAFLALH